MKSQNGSTRKEKSIKIILTQDQYDYIVTQANDMKYSLRAYATLKTLDDNNGTETLKRQIMQIMPKFYNKLLELEDQPVRKALTEMGEQICRILK